MPVQGQNINVTIPQDEFERIFKIVMEDDNSFPAVTDFVREAIVEKLHKSEGIDVQALLQKISTMHFEEWDAEASEKYPELDKLLNEAGSFFAEE